MNPDKLTWYVARSGGIIAWSVLALSLILGLLLSSRLLGRKGSPAWILSIHRFLGGLGVIFTAIHVAAIMLDDFVDFGFVEALIPWASNWRPGPTAWGIIAMYLMVAIEITSLAMRQIPKPLWRVVHWMSAPLFVMASVHGYQSGADAGRAFIVAISSLVAILTILTAARVRRSGDRSSVNVDPRAAFRPTPRLYDEERELAFASATPRLTDATPPVDAAAPPKWGSGAPADSDDPMSWISSSAEGNPHVRRRPGPAPGVWKRSERDLDDYR